MNRRAKKRLIGSLLACTGCFGFFICGCLVVFVSTTDRGWISLSPPVAWSVLSAFWVFSTYAIFKGLNIADNIKKTDDNDDWWDD